MAGVVPRGELQSEPDPGLTLMSKAQPVKFWEMSRLSEWFRTQMSRTLKHQHFCVDLKMSVDLAGSDHLS